MFLLFIFGLTYFKRWITHSEFQPSQVSDHKINGIRLQTDAMGTHHCVLIINELTNTPGWIKFDYSDCNVLKKEGLLTVTDSSTPLMSMSGWP